MPSAAFGARPVRSAELSEALGRVVLASAEADQTLTKVLEGVAGVNDHNWILFRGQSTDWLIQSILELIKFGASPRGVKDDDVVAIRGLVATLQKLHGYRNTVIHGVWTDAPTWGEVDDDDPEWRPRPRFWGRRDDEPVIYCHRTRLRKIPPDQEITVSDVAHLADLIEKVNEDLRKLMSSVR